MARAQAFMVSNGYPASVITSLQVGRYCADIDIAATQRFFPLDAVPASCQGNGLSNAVQLQTLTTSKRYLTAVLGSAVTPEITASATATRIDEAGLEMTSGVLTLDTGLVNSVLSLLAGRNIALTSATIQALLANNVDAGLMFDALALEEGETGTYSDLTARTVSMADLLNAAASAMQQTKNTDPVAIAGMQALASAIGSGVQVPLAKLFELGVWKKMPVGYSNTQPSLRAGLNAYQLLAYALEVNGTSLLGSMSM